MPERPASNNVTVPEAANPSLLARLLLRRGRKRMLRSGPCTQAQLISPQFQDWGKRLGERPMHLHRKVWEYCYITQALHERDLLRQGLRGLGFAVGREPLAAFFAGQGCEIVATDLAVEEAAKGGWVETSQHAESLEALNGRNLCPADLFRQRVSFRIVDMRQIPADLGTFDFVWSACSFEHLGSLALGERFVFDALRFVKPGGFAVHTTEYNVSSNTRTQPRP